MPKVLHLKKKKKNDHPYIDRSLVKRSNVISHIKMCFFLFNGTDFRQNSHFSVLSLK